jgi:formylglycine-generating enzyme required for sulfatase activity
MDTDIQKSIATGAASFKLPIGKGVLEMMRISPGDFFMGSPAEEEGRSDNEPHQEIRISQPFYLGRHLITQAQYQTVMGTNPSRQFGDHLPVDQVKFHQALTFCEKLSSAAKLTVTLPTEAQWEYACRAGTRTRFYSGQAVKDLERVAWFRDNAEEKSHPVGEKEPNPWGLYDMHGNVWEFCRDFLPAGPISSTDPVGEREDKRGAIRGGGWMNDAADCRSACRMRSNDNFGGTGIRIVVVVPTK